MSAVGGSVPRECSLIVPPGRCQEERPGGETWLSGQWSLAPDIRIAVALGSLRPDEPYPGFELVAPGQPPAEWEQWPSTVQDSIVRQRQPGEWYLLFKGVAAYSGYGDPIDASRAGRIAQAFRPPLCFAQFFTAGFYDDAGFCQDCDAPTATSTGTCPSLGTVTAPRPWQELGPALVAVSSPSPVSD